MRELLSKALLQSGEEDARTNRILAASFYRSRPLQAGSCARVISVIGRIPREQREGFLGRNVDGGLAR